LLSQWNEISTEIAHEMEEDSGQGAAVGVVVNPGE